MNARLTHVKKCFGDLLVFADASLDFSRCGIYYIKGKSGCGKTTLLNIIAGLEPFDEGERVIDPDITIVSLFQDFALIPELTVLENIALHHELYASDTDWNPQTLLKSLNMEPWQNHYPAELSQGQRQRVAILRVLSMNPDILLCDEPTEALDYENKKMVLSLLKQLSKTKAVIITSHDNEWIEQLEPMIWECCDHTLLSCNKKDPQTCITIQPKNGYEQHRLHVWMGMILNKRSLIHHGVIALFTLMIVLLIGYGVRITQTDQASMLNPYVLAVQVYSQDERNHIQDAYPNTRVILDMNVLNTAQGNVSIRSYPFINGTLDSTYEIPQDDQILINQNVAYLLQAQTNDSIIGKPLTLSFWIQGKERSIPFTISGIIEETKIGNVLHAYYNETYVMEYLHEIEIEQMSADLFLQKNGLSLLVPCDFNTYHQTYEKFVNQGYVIHHAGLEYEQSQQEEASLSQTVLRLLLLFLILAQAIYVMYAMYVCWYTHVELFAALVSMEIALFDIRKVYLHIQIRNWMILFIPTSVLSLMSITLWLGILSITAILYLLGCFFFVWIVHGFFTHRIQKQHIAYHLKRRTDFR